MLKDWKVEYLPRLFARSRILFEHQLTIAVAFLSGTGSRFVVFPFLRGVQLVENLHQYQSGVRGKGEPLTLGKMCIL